MMEDLMIDLETAGTKPNAPILSIGAVAFDATSGKVGGANEDQNKSNEFHQRIDLTSAVAGGAVIDPKTFIWWLGQGEAARSALTSMKSYPESDVLRHFHNWILNRFNVSKLHVWGNAPSFDCVILSESMGRNGLTPPWRFWNERDFRTLKALYPEIESQHKRAGTHHSALEDSRYQAEVAVKIMQSRDLGDLL